MPVRRLAIPLSAIAVLLVVAGMLELASLAFPPQIEAVAAVEHDAVSAVIERVEQGASRIEAESAKSESAGIGGNSGASSGEAERVRELVQLNSIVVDGAPLDEEDARSIVSSRGAYAGNVEYIDQREVLPSGCEIVALAVTLRAGGLDASPQEIAEKHVRKGNDAAHDYLGSPMTDGGGLPPVIAEAAAKWLAEHAPSWSVRDITGTRFEGVVALAALGYPVIAWITEDLVDPVPSGVDGWYRPEHCVVVYGASDDAVFVSDSLAGLVQRDRARFAHVYEACGNKAIILIPPARNQAA